jgi:hypothetical protein
MKLKHNRSYFIHFISNNEGSGYNMSAEISLKAVDLNSPCPVTFDAFSAVSRVEMTAKLLQWECMPDKVAVAKAKVNLRRVSKLLRVPMKILVERGG